MPIIVYIPKTFPDNQPALYIKRLSLFQGINVEYSRNQMINESTFHINIEKFYICGHSLGGYFSLNYALKYPQYVENKMIMMSPTGIGDPNKGGSSVENLYFGQRDLFVWTLGLLFYIQPTDQFLSKKYILGNWIKNGEDNKFQISKEENELIGKINDIPRKF